jgi:hypothetical protein
MARSVRCPSTRNASQVLRSYSPIAISFWNDRTIPRIPNWYARSKMKLEPAIASSFSIGEFDSGLRD